MRARGRLTDGQTYTDFLIGQEEKRLDCLSRSRSEFSATCIGAGAFLRSLAEAPFEGTFLTCQRRRRMAALDWSRRSSRQ